MVGGGDLVKPYFNRASLAERPRHSEPAPVGDAVHESRCAKHPPCPPARTRCRQ
ncbi:Hypothetical protein AA314_09109 [Archangium gephyra]|uniref:Uncharacterized protein n=1 Tax=Archangium gephyra TaxID=48 RepID=A0AAC8TIP0_9BACT|nr:Hypothetical protein AA314_09109 [Archangium gephyra]